ncbi:Aste57867_13389 [Aphanomyces stellatus]|uniref:Aste57867_13389 protein n=1 Tax=Aphanomyces stellatus TaxID=120398 RepID=A0A485KY08_9STRA|nr:hypothetical protein As57867_013339 [Aphanomyces stellatus]VFT90228.1 Aste57867_13389 [Aphanomyces stellatus]
MTGLTRNAKFETSRGVSMSDVEDSSHMPPTGTSHIEAGNTVMEEASSRQEEEEEESMPETLEQLMTSKEPAKLCVEEAHMQLYFDMDLTFSSKLQKLGPTSRQGESVKDACRLKPDVIDWSRTSASATDVVALSVYVSFINHHLVILNLSHNRIGPAGCTALGKALLTNNTIEVLNLSGCDVTGSPYRPNYDGVLSLIKGLESKRSALLHLDISHTALLPNGVRLLCASLAFHPTLTALNIADNQAGIFKDKQGYMGIANLVRYSTHLTSLDVSKNPFERDAHAALADALGMNHTLTSLDASGCSLKQHSSLPNPHHIRMYSRV